MVAMTEARPEVKVRTTVRCGNWLRNGRMCNHFITSVPIDEWETMRNSDTTVECARCHKVYTFAQLL